MSYGETDVAMSNPFKPMASAVGRGFRQDYRELATPASHHGARLPCRANRKTALSGGVLGAKNRPREPSVPSLNHALLLLQFVLASRATGCLTKREAGQKRGHQCIAFFPPPPLPR